MHIFSYFFPEDLQCFRKNEVQTENCQAEKIELNNKKKIRMRIVQKMRINQKPITKFKRRNRSTRTKKGTAVPKEIKRTPNPIKTVIKQKQIEILIVVSQFLKKNIELILIASKNFFFSKTIKQMANLEIKETRKPKIMNKKT